MKNFWSVFLGIVAAVLVLMIIALALIVGGTKKVVETVKKNTDTRNATNQVADGDGVRQGDIKVRITKMKVGNVPLEGIRDGESEEKLLMVHLEITNTNPNKIVNYKGWAAKWLHSNDPASLKDNHDNTYKRCHFGIDEVPGQITRNTSIRPMTTIKDVVVFEPPVDSCEYVMLELPAEAFDGKGTLRMKVLPKSWKK